MTEEKSLTLTKLARIIATKHHIAIAQAKEMLNTTFSTITDSLKNDVPVSIYWFGKFVTAQTKPRRGRNPKTGKTLDIPARRVVRFKAGKNLKDTLK